MPQRKERIWFIGQPRNNKIALGELVLLKPKIIVSVFEIVEAFNLVLMPVFEIKNLTGTSAEKGINT